MKKNATVTCIGELIADLYASGDGTSFRPSAGGAAANVAVGLARLGVPSAFAGRVGSDSFGRFLADALRDTGVDTRGIVLDPSHKTRLAFIRLSKTGERSFEFWENHPADEQLRWSDISREAIRRSAIVHLSSFLLMKEPSRRAALAVARHCSQSGRIVSFDPNLRLSLWPSSSEARRIILKMVSYTRILRLNEEEAYILTRKRRPEAAARELQSVGPSLVVITRGSKGSYFQSGAASAYAEGFRVRAVDTTGCGDAFLAGILSGIIGLKAKPEELDGPQLSALGRFANAVGALTALKRGVFPALPTLSEVRTFLKAHP